MDLQLSGTSRDKDSTPPCTGRIVLVTRTMRPVQGGLGQFLVKRILLPRMRKLTFTSSLITKRESSSAFDSEKGSNLVVSTKKTIVDLGEMIMTETMSWETNVNCESKTFMISLILKRESSSAFDSEKRSKLVVLTKKLIVDLGEMIMTETMG
jgi:hypothetical protein